MFKKIVIGCLTGVFVACILIVSNSFFANKEKDKIKEIRIGVLNTPNDIAVARNILIHKKIKNYRIKYITFDSGVDANKALLSNSIDIATMGDTNAIVALTNKIPVKLFWVNEICEDNEALVVRNACKIGRIEDLKGRTIATPFASTSHISLLYVLKKYHLLNKVRLLDMDTQNIVAAWKRKQIDAAYSWQPTLSELDKNGKILITSKDLQKMGMMTGNVTLISNHFASKHPGACNMLRNILSDTHDLRKKNLTKVIDITAKRLGLSHKIVSNQISETKWPLKNKEEKLLSRSSNFIRSMKKAGSFMAENQNITYNPTLKQYNDFLWKGE